ncbi:MAG: hypothetical protein SF097_03795 [Acidobacteriota bacterium]|nr:hypothetical protein [Acidobacteriota bacterium]
MQMNLFVSSFSLKTFVFLATLAVALLTGGQSNSQPQLSQPVMLPGDATVGDAAGGQGSQRISKGANGYLVVWQDARADLRGSYYIEYDLWPYSELLAARMDVNGNLIDYTPISITRNRTFYFKPDVVWNGRYWLITWQERVFDQSNCPWCFAIKGVRVSAEGIVVDSVPIQIGRPYEDFSVTDLESDGSNWVVAKLPPNSLDGGVVQAIRISSDGQVLDFQERTVAQVPNNLRAVGLDMAFAGDEYLVIWGEGRRTPLSGVSAHTLQAQRISLSLEPIGEQFSIGQSKQAENLVVKPRVASDGTDFLVVWLNEMRVVSHNGQVISEPVSNWGWANPFELCWDGMEYVAAALNVTFGNLELVCYRFSRTGTLLSISNGISLTRNYFPEVSITPRFGGGAQFVWKAGKPVPRIDDPTLSIFLESEMKTAGVRSDGTVSVEFTIPKSAPRQSEPSVSAGAHGFVVVYRSQVPGNTKILLQRLDENGAALDLEPIVLAIAFKKMFFLVDGFRRSATVRLASRTVPGFVVGRSQI